LIGIEDSIKFTMDIETDGMLPFLDTIVKRRQIDKLITSIYRKPTHSDRYLNFDSNHPIEHKQFVVRTLMDRAHSLSSTTKDRLAEIKYIKESLQLNSYPQHSALTKHVMDNEHSINYANARIIEFELDFTKRRFIESYFIQKTANNTNDKQNDKFPSIYSATVC